MRVSICVCTSTVCGNVCVDCTIWECVCAHVYGTGKAHANIGKCIQICVLTSTGIDQKFSTNAPCRMSQQPSTANNKQLPKIK